MTPLRPNGKRPEKCRERKLNDLKQLVGVSSFKTRRGLRSIEDAISSPLASDRTESQLW
jgi:hypothetical protein